MSLSSQQQIDALKIAQASISRLMLDPAISVEIFQNLLEANEALFSMQLQLIPASVMERTALLPSEEVSA